ncbi:hypothetical protein D3C80_1758850 [compost metagenome]
MQRYEFNLEPSQSTGLFVVTLGEDGLQRGLSSKALEVDINARAANFLHGGFDIEVASGIDGKGARVCPEHNDGPLLQIIEYRFNI